MVWVLSLKQKILVCIYNVFSEAETLKNSSTKGSILELLFCLLYVNDLPQALSDAGSNLYPDNAFVPI